VRDSFPPRREKLAHRVRSYKKRALSGTIDRLTAQFARHVPMSPE
jgi:hypothetical protein